jgi:preprotein translocase subunit SecG
METIILVIHVILALTLVGVVLLQRSEGGGLGMGGGGAATGGGLISSRGAADLLTRMTAVLAGCFMLTSVALAIMAKNRDDALSVLDAPAPEEVVEEMPAEPELPTVPLSE